MPPVCHCRSRRRSRRGSPARRSSCGARVRSSSAASRRRRQSFGRRVASTIRRECDRSRTKVATTIAARTCVTSTTLHDRNLPKQPAAHRRRCSPNADGDYTPIRRRERRNFAYLLGMSRVIATIERLDAGTNDAVVAAALDLVFRGLPDEVRRPFAEGIRLAAKHNPDALGELWRAVDRGRRRDDRRGLGPVASGGHGDRLAAAVDDFRGETEAPDPLLTALMPMLLDSRHDARPESARRSRDARSQGARRCRVSPSRRPLLSRGARRADRFGNVADCAVADFASSPEFVPVDAAAWPRLADDRRANVRRNARLSGPRRRCVRRPTSSTNIEPSAHRSTSFGISCGLENTDVGCLLLADHPSQDQLELVYMGLVPSARGRGWGESSFAKLCRVARNCGRARVVLAVDSANWPALAMYRRAGFAEFERRTVMIFSPSAGGEEILIACNSLQRRRLATRARCETFEIARVDTFSTLGDDVVGKFSFATGGVVRKSVFSANQRTTRRRKSGSFQFCLGSALTALPAIVQSPPSPLVFRRSTTRRAGS